MWVVAALVLSRWAQIVRCGYTLSFLDILMTNRFVHSLHISVFLYAVVNFEGYDSCDILKMIDGVL